jgi:hypothetical protein
MVDLINKGADLTLFDKTKIFIHMMMCPPCWDYVKHLQVMNKQYKKLFAEMTEVDPQKVETLENEVLKSTVR